MKRLLGQMVVPLLVLAGGAGVFGAWPGDEPAPPVPAQPAVAPPGVVPEAIIVPPAAPAARPDFSFVGHWTQGADTAALLDRGGRTLTLRQGEQVGPAWRIAAIAADALVVEHLPDQARWRLPLQRQVAAAALLPVAAAAAEPQTRPAGGSSSASADATD